MYSSDSTADLCAESYQARTFKSTIPSSDVPERELGRYKSSHKVISDSDIFSKKYGDIGIFFNSTEDGGIL